MRGLSTRWFGAVLIMTFGLPGCARSPATKPPPPPVPFKTVMTVKQLMNALVVPTSDVVFDVAGEAPQSNDGWLTVARNAMSLAESGNLLMLPGRTPDAFAPDSKEWTQQSLALIEAAMLAVTAADAKNVNKMSEAGDAIYAVCESCHRRFMPHPR